MNLKEGEEEIKNGYIEREEFLGLGENYNFFNWNMNFFGLVVWKLLEKIRIIMEMNINWLIEDMNVIGNYKNFVLKFDLMRGLISCMKITDIWKT